MKVVEEFSVEDYFGEVEGVLRRCCRGDRNYDQMIIEVVDAKDFFIEEKFLGGIFYCRAVLIALEFANTLNYGVRDVANLKERAKLLVCDIYSHYLQNNDEMEPSQKRQLARVFEVIFEVFYRILAFSGDRKEMQYWRRWMRERAIAKFSGTRWMLVYSLPIVGFWLGERIFDKKC